MSMISCDNGELCKDGCVQLLVEERVQEMCYDLKTQHTQTMGRVWLQIL